MKAAAGDAERESDAEDDCRCESHVGINDASSPGPTAKHRAGWRGHLEGGMEGSLHRRQFRDSTGDATRGRDARHIPF